MKKVINQKIPLKVFHCRKNRIDGELIPNGLFKKLHINKHLSILNLKANLLLNETAQELEQYSKENVYIDEIMLLKNKRVHYSVMEEIDEECRKNVLIQKHIIPMLRRRMDDKDQYIGINCLTGPGGYDVHKLEFEDYSFKTADFIFKFIRMNKRDFETLILRHIFTEDNLLNLP